MDGTTITIPKRKQTKWTNEKDQFLLESKKSMTYREIAEIMGLPLQSVTSRYMKITGRHPKHSQRTKPTWKGRPWTDEELQFIRDNLDQEIEWLARHIQRSEETTRNHRNKILREMGQPINPPYSDMEVQFLLDNANMPRVWVAKQLGRTAYSVRARYSRMIRAEKRAAAS